MKKNVKYLSAIIFLLFVNVLQAQETEIQYLSGRGSDNTVDWQFYCTEGRNSGKWTTIPVPSNWELQGFGTYNYGLAKDEERGKEKGLYKYEFSVPANWKGKTINIVFEGSMTDTEVKINGRSVGAVHQGAFYCFRYDISKMLKYGKSNLLEVTVAKHSANETVNGAERRCDFWIFGGIFRPVYLEALPKQHISQVAINAKADGFIETEVHYKNIKGGEKISAQVLTLNGQKVSKEFSATIVKKTSKVKLQSSVSSPKLWSAEFPNLYQLQITLSNKSGLVHKTTERFGFRTVEVRERDGIYINGQKVKFKGVNRHSFWPSTGRALNKKLNIEDVVLMKDMNMNSVRMSHYPPDKDFLDACDSLGLFVLDELAGWHDAYDTETGLKLVTEMIIHDQNHPSVVIWNNGNEGGHNRDLVSAFDNLDIQKRPVLFPWMIFRGIDTQHYTGYGYGNNICFNGHNIYIPTEFLHGLYDGGHGAGLKDYWELMWSLPRSGGGFLWDYADEGVVRTDRNGEIDVDGVHAPDGIIGPFHEKEGSYFAIKEIWSPVKFEDKDITSAFDFTFKLENRFMFTNLSQCTFKWTLAQTVSPYNNSKPNSIEGIAQSPDIAPEYKGTLKLNLPDNWKDFDVLYVSVTDPHGYEIYKWSWPIALPADISNKIINKQGTAKPVVSEKSSILEVKAGDIVYSFNKNTGMLAKVTNEKGEIPFNNGPVICGGDFGFKEMTYTYENDVLIISYQLEKKARVKALDWKIFPSGWLELDIAYFPEENVVDYLGISFNFPESEITGVKWLGNGPYRVWKNRMEGVTLNVWEKDYNNTVTGVSPLVYPEFKGYHSNMYWVKLLTKGQPVTVVSGTEDVFLRLFTPEYPEKTYNTESPFPKGDISFMQGIAPIGTKTKKPENMGISGSKNMFYDFGGFDDWNYRAKRMTLFFDFSGK